MTTRLLYCRIRPAPFYYPGYCCWFIMDVRLVCLLTIYFTTVWAYQPISRDADWGRSFDHNGWSECPNNFYISGMYRSNPSGRNGLDHIERVRCTQATSPSSQTCGVRNWWSSFDRKGEVGTWKSLYASWIPFGHAVSL